MGACFFVTQIILRLLAWLPQTYGVFIVDAYFWPTEWHYLTWACFVWVTIYNISTLTILIRGFWRHDPTYGWRAVVTGDGITALLLLKLWALVLPICFVSMLYCLGVRSYVRRQANAEQFGALNHVRRYQSTPNLNGYVAPPPDYKDVQPHADEYDYYNEEV